MKTYVLTLSKTFLKGHPRAGEPTNFRESYLNGIKKHTIRENYEYWSRVIDKVQAGKAVLSIRQWSGKPYASPQEPELARLDASSGIGYQRLFLDPLNVCLETDFNCYDCSRIHRLSIATNDGLSWPDFYKWFFPSSSKERKRMYPIIIHFTDFRY